MSHTFVLSTGRCGTVTLTNLLSLSTELAPSHEPRPHLFEEAIAFYEGRGPDIAPLIAATRRSTEQYVETACWFHFLPESILKAFPSAKFVHLHRNPYEYIRSGMRRGWYRDGSLRVQPVKEGLSPIEKIAWYWGFANSRILNFFMLLTKDKALNLSFQDLTRGNLTGLFKFLEVQTPGEREIQRVLSKQLNAQREGTFEWDKESKALVKPFLSKTAERLGYDL